MPEAGNVVFLKSGSLAMTVERVTDGVAFCVWFDEREELRRDSFPVDALQVDNTSRLSDS